MINYMMPLKSCIVILWKLVKKNARLKKKILELSNKKDALQKCNVSLNERVKGLQLENKTLNDKIALLKEKQSTLHEHEKSYVDNLIKENELNKIVSKFTNGQKNLEILLSSKKCAFDKGGRG